MRFCRFAVPGRGAEVRFGALDDSGFVTALDGHPFAPFALTTERHSVAEVRLLAPVLPSKVVCIGKNYADHVREMGGPDVPSPAAPVVFLKPSTSVIGPGDAVQHPRDSRRTDYEGELAIVISRLCREVPEARAADVILGYTIGNDVTARDQQQADGQWTRGKGHDTFCPLGPWIESGLSPDTAGDLELTTRLDGVVVQQARTSLLIHPIPELIAYVTAFMTLLPGDVILTGTPAGVGPMAPGQCVSVEIEGLGTLTNPVVARA